MCCIPGIPLDADLDTFDRRPGREPDIKRRLPAFRNLNGADTGDNLRIWRAGAGILVDFGCRQGGGADMFAIYPERGLAVGLITVSGAVKVTVFHRR